MNIVSFFQIYLKSDNTATFSGNANTPIPLY